MSTAKSAPPKGPAGKLAVRPPAAAADEPPVSRSRIRRERERQAVRKKILNAARKQFAKHGYETVTMRKLAESIDYTTAVLYAHFADKESLIRELVAEDFTTLAGEFRDCTDLADPWEKLFCAGRAFIRFGLRNPNHYRLMFMSPPSGLLRTSDFEQVHGDPGKDTYAFILECVRDGKAKKLFRPDLDDEELIVQTMWASFHGIVSLFVAKGRDPWIDWRDPDLIAETMLDILLRGMRRA